MIESSSFHLRLIFRERPGPTTQAWTQSENTVFYFGDFGTFATDWAVFYRVDVDLDVALTTFFFESVSAAKVDKLSTFW